jgi:hypothetical protein
LVLFAVDASSPLVAGRTEALSADGGVPNYQAAVRTKILATVMQAPPPPGWRKMSAPSPIHVAS